MNLREAATLALEVLENHTAIKHPQQIHYRDAAIEALLAALAEPNKCTHGVTDGNCKECYMAEPDQEPLTDEEIEQAYRHIYHNVPDGSYRTTYYWIEQGIRYAEQAHGIKGEA